MVEHQQYDGSGSTVMVVGQRQFDYGDWPAKVPPLTNENDLKTEDIVAAKMGVFYQSELGFISLETWRWE
ncbi:hypothetical protein M5K25_020160 [Dendrobium thyrsiflorum]|uniref:Dirigent protein n=1 Tax=Dendrobium thyrsiflorum TaxID=117978 RepID=A0ABD0UG10_DENTH